MADPVLPPVMVLGWSSRPIKVLFAQLPRVTILDLRGRPVGREPTIHWGETYAYLPYPVTAELYVDRLLDRDEFRSLCDRCSTRAEIVERLGALGAT